MENDENKKSFIGLVPFIVFILIYLGTGILLHLKGTKLAFYQLPGPVAAFVGISPPMRPTFILSTSIKPYSIA